MADVRKREFKEKYHFSKGGKKKKKRPKKTISCGKQRQWSNKTGCMWGVRPVPGDFFAMTLKGTNIGNSNSLATHTLTSLFSHELVPELTFC